MLNLFISHASRDNPKEHEFVKDLHTRLIQDFPEDKSNRVFFDEASLDAGVQWRERIFEGIGSANAGIIVLGEKALNKDNSWVLVEALLLRWKQLIVKPYSLDSKSDCTEMPLFIYLFGEGSNTRFSSDSRWEPLLFSEIQFSKQQNGNKEFTKRLTNNEYKDLKDALSKVKIPDRKDKYRQFLTNLDNQFREAHKGKINEDHFREDLKALFENEVSGLQALVRQNPDGYKPKKMLQLLYLLAPLWPSTHANHLLAKAALKETPKTSRIFTVEGMSPEFVAQTYLALPEWRSSQSSWNYICLQSLRDAPSLENVKEQIAAELFKLFPSYDAFGPVSIDINKQIKREFDNFGPTFVVFPNDFSISMVTTWIPELQKEWPDLNFLVLVETDATVPAHFEKLEIYQDPANAETLIDLEQAARVQLYDATTTLQKLKQKKKSKKKTKKKQKQN